jgi:hypothetical protein
MVAINSPLPGSTLRREPYFDDYRPEKEFYQIAFKPGLAPQARELTQLQTILQEQIGRFGNGIYTNGAPVTGAQASISRGSQGDDQVATLTPGIVYFNRRFVSVDNQLNTNDGSYTILLPTGRNNFSVAIETQIDAALTATDTSLKLRSLDRFQETGVVKIDNEFIAYTGIDTDARLLIGLTRGALESVAAAHINSSNVLSIEQRSGKRTDGTSTTFTYNGASTADYVENPTSNAEYDTWFNSRNFQIGLKVIESIVTASEDESLLDNSVGAANFNAPGADRLRIQFQLDFRPLNQEYGDFIFLLRYRNGAIIQQKAEAQFSEEVNSYLARQIDEVSGNFSVNPHTISVLEWSDKELQSDPLRVGTFALNISSGKTYVNGYRRETLVPNKLSMSKGYSNISQNYSGNGLVFRNYDSFTMNLSTPGRIQLNKLIGITTNFGGVQTFYAWIRQIERIGPTTFRVFFSDASQQFYTNFSNGVAVSFYNSEDPVTPGAPVAAGTSTSAINFTDNKLLVYNTMPNAVNFSDLTLYTKSFQTTLIPGGTSSFSLNNALPGETSPSDANQYTVTTTVPGNEVFVIDSSGNIIDTGFTLTTTGTNQISWASPPPSTSYQVYYRAYAFGSDTTSVETTQLRNTQTTANMPTPTQSKPTQNVDQFIGGGSTPGFYDVWRINSVTDNNGVVYRRGIDYILIDGQTPNYFYGSAIRWLRNRNRPTGPYVIDFNYWAHQGTTTTSANGSFITADSFTNADGSARDYLNISRYIGRRRSDFFDFRTRNNQVSIVDDVYTVGDNSQNTIDIRKRTRRTLNNESFAYDVQRYLPRWDTLFVNKSGEFVLLNGTPRISPERPKQPDNSLLLANIYVPAYPRNTGDVKLEPFESNRFTQSDIKAIERRVANLETFTLSNKLELLALNQSQDDGDVRRGIMVDDFSGHGIADVNNPEYSAAIDPIEQALRLPFTHQFFDLSFDVSNIDSMGSNILISDKTVSLDFIEERYISNENASGSFNVNPFDTFEWLGNMTLTPAVDIWVNTNEQPDILADHELQNSHFAKENPVPGWDREFNFWFRTPFGLDKRQLEANTRFQGRPPVSVTDAQVTGGLNVVDKADFVENELRNSSRAHNVKLTGFRNDLPTNES